MSPLWSAGTKSISGEHGEDNAVAESQSPQGSTKAFQEIISIKFVGLIF